MDVHSHDPMEIDNDSFKLSNSSSALNVGSSELGIDPIEFSRTVIERYEISGDTTHLDDAVQVVRNALVVKPLHFELNFQLGHLLWSRFERFGRRNDSDEAISAFQRILDTSPDDDPNKPLLLNNLGNTFQSRFERVGDLRDLEAAISVQRRAVELTPDDHPYRPSRLNNLGSALRSRFECVGELGDLDTAISVLDHAVELTPDGHPDKPAWMNDLGNALQSRFERLGELADLEAAILAKHRAVELTPDGHPDQPRNMDNLGNALQSRFQRIGELRDLEAAISVQRGAVELTPDGHPDKPNLMNNLGNAFQSCFERTGDLGDLEAAISVQRRAVELTPNGHPEKPARMSNLGNALQSRFERVYELGDLEAAISVQRRAIELTPDGHPGKAARMSNLGISLQSRSEHVGEIQDLEAAILMHRRAVELTPDSHPAKPMYMNNLGRALQRRFKRVSDPGDLEAAISVQGRALDLMPDAHPDRPMYLNNLGIALQHCFKRVGDLGDLEASISAYQRATELTPEGHPNKPMYLRNLGLSFWSFHEHSHHRLHFDTAFKYFVEAAIHSSGSSLFRFASARNCVDMLTENHEFASAEMILQAHLHVIRLLPELVWLGYSIARRYEESSQLAACVNDAVAAAIAHDALPQAVAWLEEGRSLVWSQILALRTPLNELEIHHPELSQRLRIIQQQLQRSGHVSGSVLKSVDQREPLSFAPNAAQDKHRGLIIEYGHLLSEVRSCAGFDGFLRPKTFSALLPSAELGDGYFVFINVCRTRCDALVLMPSGAITHVALPDLSETRASNLRLQWTRRLHESNVRMRGAILMSAARNNMPGLVRILECIWIWIVHPILLSLYLVVGGSTSPLPHITWCPTGPLAQLPLHAGGIFSDPTGPRLFDHAVSSYAPSLSALLRSSKSLAKSESLPSVLVVTQPATPGQSPLPGTVNEGRQVQRILDESQIHCVMLSHEQATVEAVRTVMDRHSWVHLACHGSQQTDDATQSAFHLYDGRLSLADLMQTAADDAQLAFLSACQTATGDENNPEESVHLAAGMLAVGFKGVVATMWSIGDTDAPIVVEAYYKALLELRRTGAVGKGQTGAAYALHEAVKVLREHVGERNFLSWAPFVHFGA
ncbi:TPR-like protein [Peniophora sp. CONT]|nr:TPR-like protein [Peniophora sp. CONT]